MSFFSRKRHSESPSSAPTDPMDPLAALARAEEVLSKTNAASDGQGHWMKIDAGQRAQLQDAMDQARAAYESGASGVVDDAFPQGVPAAFQQPARVEDPITQVERLARLRDSGALTDEEFEEQKRNALQGG
jgi:hypothetical protein